MKRQKIIHQQNTEEQQSLTEHQAAKQETKEFGSVEELLRHDAQHTPVPPRVGHRLAESLAQSPPVRPWWKRLLGS